MEFITLEGEKQTDNPRISSKLPIRQEHEIPQGKLNNIKEKRSIYLLTIRYSFLLHLR